MLKPNADVWMITTGRAGRSWGPDRRLLARMSKWRVYQYHTGIYVKKPIKIWSIVRQSCDLLVKGKLVFVYSFLILLLFYYYHRYFALHCMVKVFLIRLHMNESVVFALIIDQAHISGIKVNCNVILVTNVINCNGIIVKHA